MSPAEKIIQESLFFYSYYLNLNIAIFSKEFYCAILDGPIIFSFPNTLQTKNVRTALRLTESWQNTTFLDLVFPEKVKNLKVYDMRVAVWPPSGNGATFRLENLEVINYEELWFEFEYTVMGFFDATSVSIEAKYKSQR